MKYKRHIFLLSAILFFSSCGGKEVHLNCGVSEISQKGINHIQPFIEAMERYKTDNGRYPSQETDLIPGYISKIPIIQSSLQGFDESKYDILVSSDIRESGPLITSSGSSFTIWLYPKDDRICLSGRNNICEYKSQEQKWGCYQH